MDLYSFFSSMDAVIEYLDQVSPEDAKIARKRYSSFDRFQGEPQSYGYATGFGLSKSYESEGMRRYSLDLLLQLSLH
jgi:erythromycin esterase-like protein